MLSQLSSIVFFGIICYNTTEPYTDYEETDNPIGSYRCSYAGLSIAANTWFFRNPLSAVITVSEDGIFEISGTETVWDYGVLSKSPLTVFDCEPRISDFSDKVF